jgi:asparagine synthase (glutamine-hydrolysing)
MTRKRSKRVVASSAAFRTTNRQVFFSSMCGIAGIISIDNRPVPAERIKSMCDVLAHRGPDDAGYAFLRLGESRSGEGGYWCGFADPEFSHINEHIPVFGGEYCRKELDNCDFHVAFGHRRLSIIDLTSYGHQPMSSSDRRLWVTYNGEIYNFPELREGLIARGHVFRSHSDTEVLLHLWEEYGEDCVSMLNGMFAFAMYDRATNRVTLVRDRFGVKPLYYAFEEGHLLFASEIKGILASGLIEPVIDRSGLAEYFTFQNILSNRTLFEGVYLLQPGERLVFEPRSGEPTVPERYHSGFPDVDLSLKDASAVREAVAESFGNAVRRQLISDVEVGSYLSGGMDSGSIVAVAGRSIARLLTFTGGFDLTNVDGIEQGFDERKLAEKLSYLLQTEHYDMVLHAGDMPAAMERISWHMDDPRVGMCHQNWYVAKLASRFVKVCLAGAGGDELFAGYPWRYRQGLGAAELSECDDGYFRYWHRFLAPETLPQLFSPGILPDTGTPREAFDGVLANAPAMREDLSMTENLLQRMLYFEFKTFLQGFLITEDHISMAHSLETRVPFLDNELVDLAWRIPPTLKIDSDQLVQAPPDEHIESTEGKQILRRAMEKYLPVEFTQQHKQGFSPPDANWYRGPSMDYIKEILLDKRTTERPWFDQAVVGERLEEHFQGRSNNRLLIWSLLSFELLQRHFVDGAAVS